MTDWREIVSIIQNMAATHRNQYAQNHIPSSSSTYSDRSKPLTATKTGKVAASYPIDLGDMEAFNKGRMARDANPDKAMLAWNNGQVGLSVDKNGQIDIREPTRMFMPPLHDVKLARFHSLTPSGKT